MNHARQSILGFFLRDLEVIRLTGTADQVAEIPAIEKGLAELFPSNEEPMAVNFATAKAAEQAAKEETK